jgi:hypothetical protein
MRGREDGRERRMRKEPKLPPPMETKGTSVFGGERTERIIINGSFFF